MKKKLHGVHEYMENHEFKIFVAHIGQSADRKIFLCECGSFSDSVIDKDKAITAENLNLSWYVDILLHDIKDSEIKSLFMDFKKHILENASH